MAEIHQSCSISAVLCLKTACFDWFCETARAVHITRIMTKFVLICSLLFATAAFGQNRGGGGHGYSGGRGYSGGGHAYSGGRNYSGGGSYSGGGRGYYGGRSYSGGGRGYYGGRRYSGGGRGCYGGRGYYRGRG